MLSREGPNSLVWHSRPFTALPASHLAPHALSAIPGIHHVRSHLQASVCALPSAWSTQSCSARRWQSQDSRPFLLTLNSMLFGWEGLGDARTAQPVVLRGQDKPFLFLTSQIL